MNNVAQRMHDYFAKYGSSSALKNLFTPDSNEAERSAYLMYQELQRLRIELAEAASRINLLDSQLAEVREQLVGTNRIYLGGVEYQRRLLHFCLDVELQLDWWGIVDGEKFSEGLLYIRSDGKQGSKFETDASPTIDRGQRQRDLFRKLAKKAEVKLEELLYPSKKRKKK